MMTNKTSIEFDASNYHFDSHGIIEASAGSGKTTAIVHLTERLIEQKICTPDEILVITFTNNATQELKQRITQNLVQKNLIDPLDFMRSGITIKSMHSFLYDLSHLNANVLDQEGVLFDHLVLYESKKLLKGYFYGQHLKDKPFTVETLEEFLSYTDFEYQFWNEDGFFKNFKDDSFYKDKWEMTSLLKKYDYIMFVKQGLKESEVFPHLLSLKDVDDIKDRLREKKDFYFQIIKDPKWEILLNSINKKSQNKWENVLFCPFLSLKEAYEKDNMSAIIKGFLSFKNTIKDLKTDRLANATGIKEGHKKELEEYLNTIGEFLYQGVVLVEPLSLQVLIALLKDLSYNLYHHDHLINVKTQEQALEYINQYQLQKEPEKLPYRFVFIDEFQDTSLLEWETLKSLFLETDIKISLIGDPKQSIYQFKGGDVKAYFQACDDLIENQAKFYTLPKNYRTHPKLLNTLNRLFSFPQFFNVFTDSSSFIHYQGVLAGREQSFFPSPLLKEQVVLLSFDGQKQTKKDNNESDWLSLVFKEYAYWICYIKNQQPQAKIAVLSSRGPDLDKMSQFLENLGVQSYQYKKRDLFRSSMADHLFLLFFVLTRKSNEADKWTLFQTPLFDSYSSIQDKELILGQLFHLVEKQRWFDLCDFLLYEFSKDPHLSYNDFQIYKQILETLFSHAQNRSLSLDHLMDRLLTLRQKEYNMHQDNYYESFIDPEHNPVLLMTIHVSKGLEFDYVFLLFNHKSIDSSIFSVSQKGEPSRLILSALPSSFEKEKAKEALYQEQANLYYVGLTRAKLGAFVACVKNTPLPFEEFLKSLAQDSNVMAYDPSLESKSESLYKETQKQEQIKALYLKPYFKLDFNALYGDLNLKYHQYYQYSFSTLKRLQQEPDFIEQKIQENPLWLGDHTELNDYQQDSFYNQLLKGKETGTAFHYLIEEWANLRNQNSSRQLDFEWIKNFTDPLLQSMGFYDNLEKDLLSSLLQETLEIKLPLQKETVDTLMQTGRFQKEMTLNTPTVFKDIGLKAIVDMVFIGSDDRFYFIDWKTNVLPSYDPLYLQRVVDDHYQYQWKIYLVSLFEYLKERLLDFDYQKHMGGFYYCFVRGVKSPNQGVFFQEAPSFKEYQHIVEEVMELLSLNISQKRV